MIGVWGCNPVSRIRTTATAAGLDDIEYGVIYSCPSMSNYAFKVLSCDAGGWCQVFIVNEASPKGGNVTGQGKSSILALIKKNDCKTAGGNRDDKGNPPPRAPKDPPNNDDGGDNRGGQGVCSSDQQLAATPKPSDSMELKSKRAILARFQQAVDKGEKVSVGITFDSFQIGTPRTNVEDANFYETAPVGAKLYPIKSKFTLCSVFGTEITKDVTDGRYECFKDNLGDWACGTAAGYRIIKTTYEKRKKP